MMLRPLIAAFTLGLAAPAFAGEAPDWRPVDETTGQIRDVEALEQLARDFPDSGTVRLRLLQPLLGAGEVEKVMETLEWLYDRGYVFSDVAQEQIPRLLEGVDPGRIAERLRAEAEVISSSAVMDRTPPDAGLVESVVRDPVERRVIVTSVSEHSVMARRMPGSWEGYSPKDVANLSGIALAIGSRTLWVAAGNIDGFGGREGFSGLISINLDSGEQSRFPAPPDVALSDITVKGETAYMSDPVRGGLYVLRPLNAEVHELIPPGTFRSPQGLATSADNSKLYVSDYRYGIAIIDLETREVSRLASDIPVILDGVDGLWRYGNELIAVQNGTSPMRISAFELSEDGMRVVGHRILEQANPEWTEPLSGSLDGDALIYIGNGQWDRYFEGELKPGMEPLPTQIRRLPLARSAE